METAEQYDIAPDGDVVLVVGPDKSRMRVHSLALRCASKVFRTMFGPNWSEGQGLGTSVTPKEISLEDDDANALRVVLLTLHHCNDNVPDVLTPRELALVAITVDKYDMFVSLKYAVRQWWRPRIDPRLEVLDFGYLMAAAVLSRDNEIVKECSRQVILHSKGSFVHLLDDEIISQFLPAKMIFMLEERRSRIRAQLADTMTQRSIGLNPHVSAQRRRERYKNLTCGPLSMLDRCVAECVTELEAAWLGDLDEEYDYCRCRECGNGNWHEQRTADCQTRPPQLKEWMEKATVCIDCLKEDSEKPCACQLS